MPGASDSQGWSGRNEAGEGGGEEKLLEAEHGAGMDETKTNTLIIELQRILESILSSIQSHRASRGQGGKVVESPRSCSKGQGQDSSLCRTQLK